MIIDNKKTGYHYVERCIMACELIYIGKRTMIYVCILLRMMFLCGKNWFAIVAP